MSTDTSGDLYAVRKGPRPGPSLLVAAHTDEIGMLVKSVDECGYIRFEKIGGVIDNLLAAVWSGSRGRWE